MEHGPLSFPEMPLLRRLATGFLGQKKSLLLRDWVTTSPVRKRLEQMTLGSESGVGSSFLLFPKPS